MANYQLLIISDYYRNSDALKLFPFKGITIPVPIYLVYIKLLQMMYKLFLLYSLLLSELLNY